MPGPATTAAAIRRLMPAGGLGRQLTANAVGVLLLNLSSKLLTLVLSILLARWLGAERYGIYVSAVAVFALLSVPTTLGLPTLVIRLFASYRVKQQWSSMRGLLGRTLTVILTMSTAIGLIAAAAIGLLRAGLGPQQTATLWWAMLLLPLSALVAFGSATLRGLHRVVTGQFPDSIVRPAAFLGLLIGWSALAGGDRPLTADQVMGLRVAATAAVVAVFGWLLHKHLPSEIRVASPRYHTGYWARAAAPLLLVGGLGIINTQIDVFLLAVFVGPEAAGVYQAASRGAFLVAFALTVIGMAVEPTLSRLYASGDRARLQRIATVGARLALAMAIPVTLVLGLFGEPILSLVFGPEFGRGAVAMTILCVGQVVWAASGTAIQLLNMTGHEKDAAVAMGVGSVTNILLNLSMIPLWGIEGAAVATGLSTVTWVSMLVVRVHRRIGIDPTAAGFRVRTARR